MNNPKYSNKWVRRFMRRAREVCEYVSCGSRGVGCILVKDKVSIVDGFNGPPPGCKLNSERIDIVTEGKEPYIDEATGKILCPCKIVPSWLESDMYQCASDDPSVKAAFNKFYKDRKNVCPRKLLGYESGEGLCVCSCSHAEINAISFAARSGRSTEGASCFVYPISPCATCAGALISAGIVEIYTIYANTYKDEAMRILREAKINMFFVDSKLLDLNPEDALVAGGSWIREII